MMASLGLAAISVDPEARFHQLPLQGLTISSDSQALELCCGSGQATKFLVQSSQNVMGLDVSPLSFRKSQAECPSS